jgi:hypothetical protein
LLAGKHLLKAAGALAGQEAKPAGGRICALIMLRAALPFHTLWVVPRLGCRPIERDRRFVVLGDAANAKTMRELDRWSVSGRRAALSIALLFALACSGCSKSSVKLYPVQGQVLYKNQPAAGAQIVFQPQGESSTDEAKAKQPMAYGTVEADGSFTVRSEPHGAGAAPGKYDVLITWYAADPRDPAKHINKLPAKYADQEKPALVVTVKEEKNELEPFRLN